MDLDIADTWLMRHSPFTRMPPADMTALKRNLQVFYKLAKPGDVMVDRTSRRLPELLTEDANKEHLVGEADQLQA